MKRIYSFILVALSLLAITSAADAINPATAWRRGPQLMSPVKYYGALHVEGRYLMNNRGERVMLQGVSFGWHNFWGRFYNEGTVTELSHDWHATVIRAAIGVETPKGYKEDKAYAMNCVDVAVKGAVKNGVYVIIDWHSHGNTLKQAREFFDVTSKLYGSLPNVMFEVWNEPINNSWSEVKNYAEELIKVIRANAPNSIIIVGSPHWDQDVDKAADDPITDAKNIMYSLHFYAGTHGQSYRDKAQYAIDKGMPLFVTECGAMNADGDGVINKKEWDLWIKLLRANSISGAAWCIGDKDESSSMIKATAPSNGLQWGASDIKPWASFVKRYLSGDQGG